MQGSSDSPGEKPSAERRRRFTPKIPERKKRPPSNMQQQQEQNIVTKEMLDKLKLSREETKMEPAKVLNSETEVGIGGESSIRSFGSDETKTDTQGGQVKIFASSSSSSLKQDKSRPEAPIVLPFTPYEDESEKCKEPAKTTADELGLFSEKPQTFFVQFPPYMPLRKEISNPVKEQGDQGSKGRLQDFPAGLIGKMLVYKSGKVKMKMGDILFDVDPGIKPGCQQNVMAINTKEEHCCNLADVDHRVKVTPNLDFLNDFAGATNRSFAALLDLHVLKIALQKAATF